MKKSIVYLLAVLMLLSVFGCSPAGEATGDEVVGEEGTLAEGEEAAVEASEIPITYTGEPDSVTEAAPSRIMVVSTRMVGQGFNKDYFEELSTKVVAAVDGAISEGSMQTQDGIYSYYVSDKEDADYEQMADRIIEALVADKDYMRDYDFSVEIYRTRPLFRNDAATAQQIFFDMQGSDNLSCGAPPVEADGTLGTIELEKKMQIATQRCTAVT